MKLTKSHIQLIRAIQADSSLSIEQLAEKISVSHTTLWRRLKELEASGVIKGRKAIIDPQAVGMTICAFAYVNIVSHSDKHRSAFERLVDSTPEIVECFLMTGPHDYFLKIRAQDMSVYEKILMETILANSSVASASSNITLSEHKSTTELPL